MSKPTHSAGRCIAITYRTRDIGYGVEEGTCYDCHDV
jgi:hypothetical protein